MLVNNENTVKDRNKTLRTSFILKYLGTPKQLLGIDNAWTHPHDIRLSATRRAEKLWNTHSVSAAKPAICPMNLTYDPKIAKNDLSSDEKNNYLSIIRRVLYLVVNTRLGIAAAAIILGNFVKNPRAENITAAERVL